MSGYSLTGIKNWAVEDRPREKMMDKGISALSNAELIAILLATGTKNNSAVDLAKQILAESQNNLHLLGKKNITDFTKISGIGKAKAITIMAALELGRRRKGADIERVKLNSSNMVFEIIGPLLADLPHEEMWAIFTNRSNNYIDKHKISMGGVSGTVVDIRIILKIALEKLASGIFLAHNHPSGNINPSKQDIDITDQVKESAKLLDMKLLDHLIVADNNYYSFADNGLL